MARQLYPDLGATPNAALPMLLLHALPPLIGAIGLAAVFSAEISAADAVLFMLTTSLSQDLYKRFANPDADDRQLLRVSRWTSIVAAGVAFALAIVLGSVVDALTIFYTLLDGQSCSCRSSAACSSRGPTAARRSRRLRPASSRC